ncbi:MAG TPA: hybrid sensor histidine kinase/response regulator, partial [Thiolapillus brandeum]|nr:hybrid sensor histidine kinase/response regulator [Thiolapillus brandeum]
NMLARMGFEVDVAHDGFEAVEAAKGGRYRAILMDCQMPGMDGFEATRRIRGWEKTTKADRSLIIAVTANTMEGDRERCLKAGMDDYIAKPIKRAVVAEILEKWLPDNLHEEGEEEMTEENHSGKESVDLAILDELQDLMEEGFADLLKTYLRDSPQRLMDIRDAIKAGDAEMLRGAAHTLKSSSANMGALLLSELAKKLEMLGREGTTKGAARLFNQALAEYKLVKEVLKTRL